MKQQQNAAEMKHENKTNLLDLRGARQKGAYKSYGPHASPRSFQIFKYAKAKQHEHKIVKYYKYI